MEIRPIVSALLRNKTGPVLVAVQVALSLAILANALHIVQVRQAVAARPSGVANEEQVFSLGVRRLEKTSHEQQLAIQQRQTAALRALPGVRAVAATNQMPLSRSGTYGGINTDRKQTVSLANPSNYMVADSVVAVWGLRLVEGRDFRADDYLVVDQNTSKDFPQVVILTQALARKVFPGETSFVGRTVYNGSGDGSRALRVIGVVEALQTPAAQTDERGGFSTIVPIRLTGDNTDSYTLRAEAGQLERVMKEAEAAIRASLPTPQIVRVKSLSKMRTDRYQADQAMSWILLAVSALLLIITASGIVGMASLWVTQRRKQIGVRRALGARRADILRYFVTENVLITSAGVAAGVLLALGLNQLLVSQMELARLPAGYLVGGALIFWALGMLAVFGPAWRAASTSPAIATRSA